MQRLDRSIAIDIGVELEPALAALPSRPCIPGNTERLITAARHRQQILLQRIDPKGVLGNIDLLAAIRTECIDQKLAVTLEEGTGYAAVAEAGVIEIAKHGIGICFLHGLIVVRPDKLGALLDMTGDTALTANIVPTAGCGNVNEGHILLLGGQSRRLQRGLGFPGSKPPDSDGREHKNQRKQQAPQRRFRGKVSGRVSLVTVHRLATSLLQQCVLRATPVDATV